MTRHWLYVLFAPLVALLGSDDFRTRERATAGLRAVRPASDVALRAGALSPNPEIAFRSRRALTGTPPHYVGSLDTLIAYHLIVTDFEDYDGLPWLPYSVEGRYAGRPGIRAAVVRVSRIMGLTGDGVQLACDPTLTPPDQRSGMWHRYILGIQDMRFRYRGLGTPTFWRREGMDTEKARSKWAEIKKRRAERDGD